MQRQSMSVQQEMLRQRLPFIIIVMVVVCVILVLRVIWVQFPQDPRILNEFAIQRDANAGRTERFESPRGAIYDRNLNPMAVNRRQYRLWASPNLISNPSAVAAQLAVILDRDELELYNLLRENTQYAYLDVIDPETWRAIRDLDLFGIEVERIQRRYYPQLDLAGQVIGFVVGEGEDARGTNGVEGYYESRLAGVVREQEVSNIPLDQPEDPADLLARGSDLVLTIDRDVQYLVETTLQQAVQSTGADGGTIIVMDPNNGDILAMASEPGYDPNQYAEVYTQNPRGLRNPAISDGYEPGSVFKIVTVAAALETGAITPEWTYYDSGLLSMGGIDIQNWDRAAHGTTDVTTVLVNSYNVGTATIAQEMGMDDFYQMLDRFGIGRRTGVDLQGEEAGILRTPNSLSGDWSVSDLGTNSFGQGLFVTPLQMLTAANAIANDGKIYKPRIVHQEINEDRVRTLDPEFRSQPISRETAETVRNMMIQAVNGLDQRASVPGYAVAGKTGTAQISTPLGYDPNNFNMTFIGFLPADDPAISVLVKLDEPDCCQWASEAAAPVFSDLASRLVYLLDIPPDAVQQYLEVGS